MSVIDITDKGFGIEWPIIKITLPRGNEVSYDLCAQTWNEALEFCDYVKERHLLTDEQYNELVDKVYMVLHRDINV